MYEWVERAKGKGCKEHIYALSELADAYYELELDEDAIEVGKTIYSYSVAEYGMDDEYTALVLENLAKLYYLNGETDEALDRLDLLLEVYERNQPKVEKLLSSFQSGKGSIFLTLRFSNLWGVMS